MKKYQFYVLIGMFALCLMVGVVRSVRLGGMDSYEVAGKGKKGMYVLEIFVPIYYGASEGMFGSKPHVGTWIQEINKARLNPNIVGLLIRINSPGGSVVATQELYESLLRFKKSGKKIVVSVIDICASGSYYIALPADEIMANAGSLVGSIGVIAGSMEYTDLMKKIGVRVNVVKSGDRKDILSPFRRMTPQERTELQLLIDEMHQQFVDVVIKWRKEHSSAKVLRRRANGMIYSAQGAKKYGLIDSIGDFQKAKEALAHHCGVDLHRLRVITKKKKGFWALLTNESTWYDGVLSVLLSRAREPSQRRLEYR